MGKILFVTMILLTLSPTSQIHVGNSFPWTVYYDGNKTYPVVEVEGVKYGYLDFLSRTTADSGDVIAQSQTGSLYIKDNNLYYKNESLSINVKLKKKEYSAKIDRQRKKVFEINTFNELRRLRDLAHPDESKEFDWNTQEDYLFYRNNDVPYEDYIHRYKARFQKK